MAETRTFFSKAKATHRLIAALAAGLAVTVLAFPAPSQELDHRQQTTQRELAAVETAMKAADDRRNALNDEIARLENDRAGLNKALIDASAHERELESGIAASEARLADLQKQQAETRQSLQDRRQLLGQVIGALQRMGINPPPALLVTPGDALASIRSAILLGAVVPELRTQTHILATELDELKRIGEKIDAERLTHSRDLMRLADEEERLGRLLEEKKALTGDARRRLADESARAAELAAKAGTLSKLIKTLETKIASAREAADAARRAETERRRKEAERLAQAHKELEKHDFTDTARIAPAMEFEAAKGLLPSPVAGEEIRSFGDTEPLEGTAEGLYIATRAASRVVSPADGWVVYAGPFRSYGQLLILNAGNGYHVVLAGMDRIDVQMGQFVLAGEPVAVMGARRIASASAVDMESSRPVLYVEFRKDGKPIDPSPWWSDATLKRDAHDS